MADISSDNGDLDYESDGGFYKRFSLSESKTNSLSYLLPSSCDNEELIIDVKQPSLSSVNLTDSVCSSSTIGSMCNGYKLNQGLGITDHVVLKGGFDEVTLVNDSEPEDMQDISYSKINKSILNSSDATLKHLCDSGINCSKQNLESESFIDPLNVRYRNMYTSSPLSSLCMNKKLMSISLQDVSTIDIFPLESKTNNAFSTETIQTQSMSSTTKSKDSGFQRSASCLSLNSGNRSYNNVQSKVKQYIKGIKESEALRKRQKRLQENNSLDLSKNSTDPKGFVVNVSDITLDDPKEMVKTIGMLKDELKEKDTILNELQQNYTTLLERYAEAINQIDLMRLKSSLPYDYHSDLNSDITVNNYTNKNNSSLYFDYNRKDSGLSVSNDNMFYKKYNTPPQHVSFHKSNISNNSVINSNDDVQPVLSVESSDFHLESVSNNKKNNESVNNRNHYDYKNLYTIKSNNEINDCNNKANFVHISENHRNDNDNWKHSSLSSETQVIQPESHSPSLNTASSVKSVLLRPISRMYSSSSRLDKQISPLPSATCSLTSVFKSNNSKNVKSATVYKNSESHKYSYDNNKYSLETDNNSKECGSRSGTGTFVCDDNELKVPYLNCQTISKLELPKVDPFDKVKKWQASLPTISLVKSQSSSSVGSIENFEITPCRRSSLGSKLDNEHICHNSLSNSHSEKKSSRDCSSKAKFVFDDLANDFCLVSKCEQNLSSSKNPRIYFDFYDPSKTSSIELGNKNQTKDTSIKTRNSKNVLQRSDALDLSNEERVMIQERNVDDTRKADSLQSIAKTEEDELLSGLDESSSMSSSILSSTKHKDIKIRKKNLHYTSLFNTKNINKKEAVRNTNSTDIIQHYSIKPNKTNIDSYKVLSQGSVDQKTSTNKKRIGFSLSAQLQIKSNEESQEIPFVRKMNAWDSPKHVVGVNSSNMIKKDIVMQETLDVKSTKFSKNICQNSISQQRKDRLRHYTEILSNTADRSDVEAFKSFANVGTQVTDEFGLRKMSNTVNFRSQTSKKNQVQDLEDADECVKYIIQEVERIHGHLMRLQTSFINDEQS